jgi:hypothetical protein
MLPFLKFPSQTRPCRIIPQSGRSCSYGASCLDPGSGCVRAARELCWADSRLFVVVGLFKATLSRRDPTEQRYQGTPPQLKFLGGHIQRSGRPISIPHTKPADIAHQPNAQTQRGSRKQNHFSTFLSSSRHLRAPAPSPPWSTQPAPPRAPRTHPPLLGA